MKLTPDRKGEVNYFKNCILVFKNEDYLLFGKIKGNNNKMFSSKPVSFYYKTE